MFHCLPPNPIRCSPNVTRSCGATVGPQSRCHSSRVVPTYRSKTSTDFLIIPERRKADIGLEQEHFAKQYSMPLVGDPSLVEGGVKPRCRSTHCPAVSRFSPLVSPPVVQNQRRSVNNKAEAHTNVFPFSRSERRTEYPNPLLETNIEKEHHDGVVSEAESEEKSSSGTAHGSDNESYDRDAYDIDAPSNGIYALLEQRERPLPVEVTASNLKTDAPLCEPRSAGQTFSLNEKGEQIPHSQKPYFLPRETGPADIQKVDLEYIATMMPDTSPDHTEERAIVSEFLRESKLKAIPQQTRHESPMDFSVTFRGRQAEVAQLKPTQQVREVASMKKVGTDVPPGGRVLLVKPLSPRQNHVDDGKQLPNGNKGATKGVKGLRSSLPDPETGVLTRRQAAIRQEKSIPSRVDREKRARRNTERSRGENPDKSDIKVEDVLVIEDGLDTESQSSSRSGYLTQMEKAGTSASLQEEMAMEDFECSYSKWLKAVRTERIPSIMSAFREWRDIQFALQCLNFALEPQDSVKRLENPVLQDVYVSLKSCFKGSTELRKEVVRVNELMQECLKTMGAPLATHPESHEFETAREGVHKGPHHEPYDATTAFGGDDEISTLSSEHRETEGSHEYHQSHKPSPPSNKRRRTKEEPIHNVLSPRHGTAERTQHDWSPEETLVIEVDECMSPDADENDQHIEIVETGSKGTFKRRRSLTIPLSPFVSLHDGGTPPKKKCRVRHRAHINQSVPEPRPSVPAPSSSDSAGHLASVHQCVHGKVAEEDSDCLKKHETKIMDGERKKVSAEKESLRDEKAVKVTDLNDQEGSRTADKGMGDTAKDIKGGTVGNATEDEDSSPSVEEIDPPGPDISRVPKEASPVRLYPKVPEGMFCHIHGDVVSVDKAAAKMPFHYACEMCDRVAARIRTFCRRMQWRLERIERSKRSSWFVHCYCYHNHMIQGDFSFLKAQQGCPICMENSQREVRAQKQEMRLEDEWAQENQRRIFATARQNLLNAAASGGRRGTGSWGGNTQLGHGLAFSDADKDGAATIDSLLRCSNERNPWIVLCIGTKRSSLSYQEAKARYKKWVKRVHPDKNSHPSAKEAFHILDTAWKRIESFH